MADENRIFLRSMRRISTNLILLLRLIFLDLCIFEFVLISCFVKSYWRSYDY